MMARLLMRGRFWRTLIAVLILVTQGLFDLSPVVAVALAPTTAPTTEAEKKAVAVCKCIHCQSGENCCCQIAENPTDALVLKAVCDTPQDTVYQRVLIPRALPSAIVLPLMWEAVLPPAPIFIALPLLKGRTPTPLTQPPCFG